MIKQVKPVIDYSVRGYCVKAYPGHKKGCPNFNKRKDCPPFAPFFDKYIDLDKPVYAIAYCFDFKTHKDKMRSLHPKWTQRQVECCLYWQGTARKQLKIEINSFLVDHPDYEVFITPEAMGVDIGETVKPIGINLVYPPQDQVWKIALAGIPINNESKSQGKQLTLF